MPGLRKLFRQCGALQAAKHCYAHSGAVREIRKTPGGTVRLKKEKVMKNEVFEPINLRKELERYRKEFGRDFSISDLLEVYRTDFRLSFADRMHRSDDGHDSMGSQDAPENRKQITINTPGVIDDLPVSRYTLVYAKALDDIRGFIVIRDNEDMSINCGLIEMFFWNTDEGMALFFSPKTVSYGGDRMIRNLAEHVVKKLYEQD